MTKPQKLVKYAFYLTSADYKQLQLLLKLEHRSASAFFRQAIREVLKNTKGRANK